MMTIDLLNIEYFKLSRQHKSNYKILDILLGKFPQFCNAPLIGCGSLNDSTFKGYISLGQKILVVYSHFLCILGGMCTIRLINYCYLPYYFSTMLAWYVV